MCKTDPNVRESYMAVTLMQLICHDTAGKREAALLWSCTANAWCPIHGIIWSYVTAARGGFTSNVLTCLQQSKNSGFAVTVYINKLHSTSYPLLHSTFPFLYTMLLCYVPSASMITLLIYTRYITACKTSQWCLCPVLDLANIGDQYFQGRTNFFQDQNSSDRPAFEIISNNWGNSVTLTVVMLSWQPSKLYAVDDPSNARSSRGLNSV